MVKKLNKTWFYECIIVFILLVIQLIISSYFLSFSYKEIIGLFAVMFSFMHGQVSDRLQEKQSIKIKPDVECYKYSTYYFITKEIFWILYFIISNTWSALSGAVIFSLYPIWRKIYRKFNPIDNIIILEKNNILLDNLITNVINKNVFIKDINYNPYDTIYFLMLSKGIIKIDTFGSRIRYNLSKSTNIINIFNSLYNLSLFEEEYNKAINSLLEIKNLITKLYDINIDANILSELNIKYKMLFFRIKSGEFENNTSLINDIENLSYKIEIKYE